MLVFRPAVCFNVIYFVMMRSWMFVVLVANVFIKVAAPSRFKLLGLLLSVFSLFCPHAAQSQEIKPAPLVSYLIAQSVEVDARRSVIRLSESVFVSLTEDDGSLRLTSIDRWQKFEAEFGIRETRATPLRYGVANAMYRLNVVIFALSSAAQDLGSLLHWKRSDVDSTGDSLPLHTIKTVFGRLNEMQFKVDAEKDNDNLYVGLRLQIPFGS